MRGLNSIQPSGSIILDLIKNTTSRQLTKTSSKPTYVALYSKKDKEIIGYAKVEEIDYVSSKELISKGVNWNLSQNEYLLFSLSEIVPCKLKFSGMTPQGKFYTNLFCFNQYLNNSVEEDFLKFVNFESIRLWKEVKNLDPKCRFTKTDQILSFTYGNQEWECIQDKNNKQLFYINGRPYSLTQNLKEFLLEGEV